MLGVLNVMLLQYRRMYFLCILSQSRRYAYYPVYKYLMLWVIIRFVNDIFKP